MKKNKKIITKKNSGNSQDFIDKLASLKYASKKDSKQYLLNNRYVKGENLIYVCVNNSCKFPVNKVTEALKILND